MKRSNFCLPSSVCRKLVLVCIWANIRWETLLQNKVQYRMGPRKFEVKEGPTRPANVDSNWSTDTRSSGFMCGFVISRDFVRMKDYDAAFRKYKKNTKECHMILPLWIFFRSGCDTLYNIHGKVTKTVMLIYKLLLSFGQCIVGRHEGTVKSLLFDRCCTISCKKNW